MDSQLARVDDTVVGVTRRHDGRGRPLVAWEGCRALEDEFFLIGDRSPASFDSRYFGPVASSAIVGRVEPLWTW